MNNRANFTAPYSMLNPETNSDSPSAKSNGVRFNSAMQDRPHRVNNGKAQIILNSASASPRLKSLTSKKIAITKKAKLIS